MDDALDGTLYAIVNSFRSRTVASTSTIIAPTSIPFVPSITNTITSTPMNIDNIERLLEDFNAPLKITKSEKRSHQGTRQSSGSSKCRKIYGQCSSNSEKREKEKRFYKMPPEGLITDAWSWKQYGDKNLDNYRRKYYKCTTSDCTAKRRVEHNNSDPDSLILKYTSCHNHPSPIFMNNNIPTTSGVSPKNDDDNNNNNNNNRNDSKDDDIYEGLENLDVDL